MVRAPSPSPAHDLMPDEVMIHMPRIGETSEQSDPIVQVKWFTPDGSWTWFVTEYDPVDRIGFGLVHGFEKEWGSFSLDEIQSVRGILGLPVERDLHFEPRPVSAIKD